MRPLVLALCCAALVLAGCGGDDSSSEKATSTPAKAEVTPIPTKPTITKPPGAKPKTLVKKDIQVGSGATAEKGKEVAVQYVGVSYSNGRQFDASWDRGQPFTFTLGQGSVIPGWEQGVEGMKVGGRRQLIIPPKLAYGPQGQPPTIGPNETLIFVIDLLSVK
jgi:peptidylprolyl isomerase